MTLIYHYKTIRKEGKNWLKLPQLPIELIGRNNKRLRTVGTLDSGATHIVMPKEIAEALDLKLEKNKEPLETYDKKLKTADTEVVIEFGKSHQSHKKRYKALVPLEDVLCEETILGRTFFHGLKITFEESKDKFSIKITGSK